MGCAASSAAAKSGDETHPPNEAKPQAESSRPPVSSSTTPTPTPPVADGGGNSDGVDATPNGKSTGYRSGGKGGSTPKDSPIKEPSPTRADRRHSNRPDPQQSRQNSTGGTPGAQPLNNGGGELNGDANGGSRAQLATPVAAKSNSPGSTTPRRQSMSPADFSRSNPSARIAGGVVDERDVPIGLPKPYRATSTRGSVSVGDSTAPQHGERERSTTLGGSTNSGPTSSAHYAPSRAVRGQIIGGFEVTQVVDSTGATVLSTVQSRTKVDTIARWVDRVRRSRTEAGGTFSNPQLLSRVEKKPQPPAVPPSQLPVMHTSERSASPSTISQISVATTNSHGLGGSMFPNAPISRGGDASTSVSMFANGGGDGSGSMHVGTENASRSFTPLAIRRSIDQASPVQHQRASDAVRASGGDGTPRPSDLPMVPDPHF